MNKHDLWEGLDADQQAELGDLHELEAQFNSYDIPEPDSAALLKRLKPMIAQPVPQRQIGIHYWLWLARSQLSLVDRNFWWSSTLLVVLGVILCAASNGAAAILYALLSPMLAVGGVAYIFRPTARSLREMEMLSAVRPLEMLYARLVLLFAYNGLLILLFLLVAWSQGMQIVIGRLLLIWFGPMIGLTGLALYSTIRWNTLTGIIAPLIVWAGLIFLGWHEVVPDFAFNPLWTDLLQVVQQSNVLVTGALIALVGGVVLMGMAGGMIERKWSA
jgi:hypothetical protein